MCSLGLQSTSHVWRLLHVLARAVGRRLGTRFCTCTHSNCTIAQQAGGPWPLCLKQGASRGTMASAWRVLSSSRQKSPLCLRDHSDPAAFTTLCAGEPSWPSPHKPVTTKSQVSKITALNRQGIHCPSVTWVKYFMSFEPHSSPRRFGEGIQFQNGVVFQKIHFVNSWELGRPRSIKGMVSIETRPCPARKGVFNAPAQYCVCEKILSKLQAGMASCMSSLMSLYGSASEVITCIRYAENLPVFPAPWPSGAGSPSGEPGRSYQRRDRGQEGTASITGRGCWKLDPWGAGRGGSGRGLHTVPSFPCSWTSWAGRHKGSTGRGQICHKKGTSGQVVAASLAEVIAQFRGGVVGRG